MAGTSTVRIAWRSLWRNGRRTSLAVAAIGLSVALVLASDSVLRAYGHWIVETVTGPMLGHVQAHAPGWRKDRAMDRTLARASEAVAATTMVYSMEPYCRSFSTTWATVERFCPMAT